MTGVQTCALPIWATYELLIKERPEHTLLVYHGGFASKLKRSFLAKVYDAFPNVSYDHWSDIDLGGVRIYKMLKKIIPSVKPLMMDSNVLVKLQNQAVLIEEPYRLKLVQLLSEEKDPDVIDIIKGILETGLRLEQEHIDVRAVIAFITNDLHPKEE